MVVKNGAEPDAKALLLHCVTTALIALKSVSALGSKLGSELGEIQ